MVIDIISYTAEQFARLDPEQVRAVESAQTKKNRMTEELAADKREAKFKLVKAGVFRSAIYSKIVQELDAAYSREIEDLKEGLLFYLQYGSNVNEESAPYEVDYSLSGEKRAVIVKDYYNDTYSDATERFEAFKNDEVAKVYLGEYYSVLFDYFYFQIE